jgi:hypothetical protein
MGSSNWAQISLGSNQRKQAFPQESCNPAYSDFPILTIGAELRVVGKISMLL